MGLWEKREQREWERINFQGLMAKDIPELMDNMNLQYKETQQEKNL